ncbi:MAG: exodeoxyribonuclease III [Candidatus Hydrogenedentes bacterium]|jgi:exodeoxyribonuclease-3|nr:exodeoxyribonuclease III [Candidatus Hydrogenedentota bacterium]
MSKTILSWNVNGMRAVLKNGFMDWLAKTQPDILCVQESRALPDQLPPDALEPKGYTSFWMPAKKKGYSGVAAFVREEPLSVSNMGQKEFDDEGRVQLLEYKNFTILNCYFPNSQPERKRIEYKLKFCAAIRRCCNKLVKEGRNVILCGDYNIAHKEIDIARPEQNEDSPGYLPEERAEMTKFLKAGYVDTFRHFCPDPHRYTWWSYRSGARRNNVGWRLDYHCVNKDFISRVAGADILSKVMGSDHCPVSITIK